MARPNFLIIGAMKCGTSTLAAQLGAQEGLFMTTPKEPNFFSDDDVFARGIPWYEALFDGAQVGDIKGEASTHYTKLPTHPHTVERMRAVLPEPRLVYMVRNPIQRAVSHFMHDWTERRMSGDLNDAFDTYPELIEYGLYAKQIAPFIDAFGKESICLTSLERLKANPQNELERVAAHIGHLGKPIWRSELGAQNVSQERIRKLPFHTVIIRNPISRVLRRALVPKAVRTRLADSRRFGARPRLNSKTEANLRARFAEDQIQLANLFPDILTLDDQRDIS